jgi:hypothetical protein
MRSCDLVLIEVLFYDQYNFFQHKRSSTASVSEGQRVVQLSNKYRSILTIERVQNKRGQSANLPSDEALVD